MYATKAEIALLCGGNFLSCAAVGFSPILQKILNNENRLIQNIYKIYTKYIQNIYKKF